MLIAHGNYVK